MKVRAITIGRELTASLDPQEIAKAGQFAKQFRAAYADIGVPVQTVRLATQPFPQYLEGLKERQLIQFAKDLQECCHDHGIDYCALGPVNPHRATEARLLQCLPALISETETIFASAILGDLEQPMSSTVSRAIAQVIREIAMATPGGFGNLRFAGLVNCPPHIPFFPAAFHWGEPAFSIALEAADIIAAACFSDSDCMTTRVRIRKELETRIKPVQEIAQRFATRGFRFSGIDLSPAPGPDPDTSIAYALERFGYGYFGEPGTLAAAAIVTAALKETQLITCGYCGLMLPVLEDAGLAERNNQGFLRLSSLLAYSAICGTGLDTIPLPGDASEEKLTALLFDVAALGWKLGKPLSARLLPIPGQQAGEPTEFDFSYFVNTRIMSIE